MKQYFILMLMLVLYNCSTAQQNQLPVTRPADFTLSFHFDGGMSYHFEDIVITKDSCIYKVNLKGSIHSRKFKMTETDLDSLYAMLQKNQFTQIEYGSKGFVHDRGGETITIGWGNIKRYTVNDAQSSFVQNEWKQKWIKVCTYVKQLPY